MFALYGSIGRNNAELSGESKVEQLRIVELMGAEWKDCLGQAFKGEQEAFRKLRKLRTQRPKARFRIARLDDNGKELPFQTLRSA